MDDLETFSSLPESFDEEPNNKKQYPFTDLELEACLKANINELMNTKYLL
jgi:hypothetical protein